MGIFQFNFFTKYLSFLRWNLSAYQSAQEYLGASSTSMRDLVERWTRAQDMAMGLNRVFDILDIEPDVKTNPNARVFQELQREVRFDNVSFAYEQNRPVLKNISFTVVPGTVTAIVGPTGSGMEVGPLIKVVFAPSSKIAFAIAWPCFPEDSFEMYLTGSIISRVGPEVTNAE